LDRVKKGQAVTITIDALPGTRYKGQVQSVAVLPDQGGWFSSDTKVYPTVISIDEDVDNLKPGMTAIVEIHVEHLRDVLAVPVQAIAQRDGQNWCYVDQHGVVGPRRVELGPTNDKLVRIVAGVAAGETVVLNYNAVLTPEDPAQPTSSESAASSNHSAANGGNPS
jgi:multidrug efflux pump subunit AcrA (membrane-fusion protein)